MSRPTLSDFSPRVQAMITAQLHAVRHPRTVAIEEVAEPEPPRNKRAPEQDATPRLVAAGLPAPVREHRFHPVRRWRFDYAWPDLRVALEVEGGVWTGGRHTRGAGFLGDMDKYNAAAGLGWLVLRCTPRTVCAAATVDAVRAAMGART